MISGGAVTAAPPSSLQSIENLPRAAPLTMPRAGVLSCPNAHDPATWEPVADKIIRSF